MLQENDPRTYGRLLPGSGFAIDRPSDDEDTLYAFYDLKWYPVSFDIAYFLMSAEVVRGNRGLPKMVLVFVPGQDTLRPDVPPDDANWDLASHVAWRFDHICVRIVPMFPTIAGMIVARSRVEGFAYWTRARHQFPDRRDPANLPFTPLTEFHYPTFVQIARDPSRYVRPQALPETLAGVTARLAPRLGARRLIAITLRLTRFSSARNSNIDAWMKFAESLDQDLYLPIFVPDTDTAFTADFGAWNANCFLEAAFDLDLRMALYEAAWLNLSVSTGPLAIATLNERCRMLGFKFVVAGATEATAASREDYGFPVGKDPLYATRFQRWVWQDDDFPIIMREFQDMARFIEANESSR